MPSIKATLFSPTANAVSFVTVPSFVKSRSVAVIGREAVVSKIRAAHPSIATTFTFLAKRSLTHSLQAHRPSLKAPSSLHCRDTCRRATSPPACVCMLSKRRNLRQRLKGLHYG